MIRTVLAAVAVLAFTLAPEARAAGLTIHGVEFGIGKFHRQDDKIRGYGNENAWKNYILPEGAAMEPARAVKNPDGSYSIFFSSADDLFQQAAKIVASTGQSIDIFNLTAHGLPGGMWFPMDVAQRDSAECKEWRQEAQGSDEVNYNHYYSPLSMLDISYYRTYSQTVHHEHQPCVAGYHELSTVLKRNAAFVKGLSANAQVTLISCIVGLGAAGDWFTKNLAKDLFPTAPLGRLVTSLYYGLGDWSLPEGMSFWDYQNDAQLKHDMGIYPVNRSDREIMQPGSIRIGTPSGGVTVTSVVDGVEFVKVDERLDTRSFRHVRPGHEPEARTRARLPSRVRIPGTGAFLDLNR
jgi:hypothetical protein